MKHYFSLIFLFVLFFSLAACASASEPEAPALKTAMKANILADSTASVQEPYINEKLGFSFAIPNSWESENYTPEVETKEIKETKRIIQYTTVSFVFQGDKDNPLLTIKIVPKSWWDSTEKKLDGTAPDYLATKGDLVYCYNLPQTCPYDVGTKADLYNSMVLLRDDIPNRFKVLGGESAAPVISSNK